MGMMSDCLLALDYVNRESFKNRNIYSETKNDVLEFMPKNEKLPEEVAYRGVSSEQWKIIEKLGDPLNCRKRVFELQNQKIENFKEVTTSDCKEDKDCINSALKKYPKVILRGGIYNLEKAIISINRVLIGHPDELVIINAQKVQKGVWMSRSVLGYLNILNAMNVGVRLVDDNLVYRVVVGNTGVYNKKSTRGIGVEQKKSGDCIVSVESYGGFNHDICPGCDPVKGGSADGFDAKHAATNATFIDVHGHHNSDHGIDFWNGGEFVDNDTPPVLRVFYSSAVKNGFNPHYKGGNGTGWKLDGEPQQVLEKNRHKGRLVYGSASCFNREKGFEKPGRTRLTFIANSSLNKKGDKEGKPSREISISVWGNAKTDDPFIIKCSYFKNLKGRKILETLDMQKILFHRLSINQRKMIQKKLIPYGYTSKIDGLWGSGTKKAVSNYIKSTGNNNWENNTHLFSHILKSL